MDWSRHKTDLKITRKARGLNTKQGVFFLLWTGTYREGRGLQELLGVSNRRGSRQLGARPRRKTDRGERWDLKDVLITGGDRREAPDFEEGQPAVGHGDWLGAPRVGVLRRTSGNGKQRSTFGSAHWSSRWCRFALGGLHVGESKMAGGEIAAPAAWLGSVLARRRKGKAQGETRPHGLYRARVWGPLSAHAKAGWPTASWPCRPWTLATAVVWARMG
jgi:hypothetical protein